MQQFKYSEFNQKVYQKQLDNGLLVTMLPMEGFHKTYAVLSTEFGSIDNTFVPDQKNELLTVPDGVAHFLEHKMFEKADHEAFYQLLVVFLRFHSYLILVLLNFKLVHNLK